MFFCVKFVLFSFDDDFDDDDDDDDDAEGDDDDDDDDVFPVFWNGQLGCHLSFGSKFQVLDFRCWKFFRCPCSDSNRFVLLKESETKRGDVT